MPAFRFPDLDRLRLALTSGAIPATLASTPAQFAVGDDGVIVDSPTAPALAKLPKLAALGITAADPLTAGETVSSWLQLLPAIPTGAPVLAANAPVLFEISADGELPGLVGEMLRLGNDRQALRSLSDGRTLLRVLCPPFYTLLRAIDRSDPLAPRAYVEAAPRVWVEVGHTHPLASQIKLAANRLLLIAAPRRWTTLDEAPWQDIYDSLEFPLPAEPAIWGDRPPGEPLRVPLKLAPATTTEPPELWVLEGDGIDRLDAWVRDLDDTTAARFSFAVGEREGGALVVLRVRPSKQAVPVVVLDAPAYRPYLKLPNLFLPLGRRLQPPLRRDAVRQLLASDAELVTWLAPDATPGGFVPQTLPDGAFRPLAEWVRYILDRDREALGRWIAAARFDFAEYICPDDVPTVAPKPPTKPRSEPQIDELPAGPVKAPPTVSKGKRPPTKADAPPPSLKYEPSELQQQLAAVEAEFLAVDGPLDRPERQRLWPRLGELHAGLGLTADAAQCWQRAAWSDDDSAALSGWRAVTPASGSLAEMLDRHLANPTPLRDDLGAFAALVADASRQAPAPTALLSRLPAVRAHLEKHDAALPVRAVWLVWSGLSGLTGDVLALARTRDRLLERLLSDGLSSERDLPAFLRYAGRGDSDRLRQLRQWVTELRGAARTWFAQPAPAGSPKWTTGYIGPRDRTPVYIDLLFAFGLARLGEATNSRSLLREAGEALDSSGDEAHRFLLAAFAYRIERVLAGKPHAGPLPNEQLEFLELLRSTASSLPVNTPERHAPYVIDRMRHESSVLDPHETFDPYRNIKADQDVLVTRLSRLPDIVDPERLRREATAAFADAFKGPQPEERRVRALAVGIALGARLGEELTTDLIGRIGPTFDALPPAADAYALQWRATALERGLFFAAHFGLPAYAIDLSQRLLKLAQRQMIGGAREAISALIVQSIGSLRLLGLNAEIRVVLTSYEAWVLQGQPLEAVREREPSAWVENLRLLTQLAVGWLQIEGLSRAEPVLAEARRTLLGLGGQRPPNVQETKPFLSLASAYVRALGFAPFDYARVRIDELFAPGQLQRFPNNTTTSTHYSLLHLNLVEAVVLAMVTDDVAVGPAVRRWLEEDEYLIRRRIHADTRRALAQSGW